MQWVAQNECNSKNNRDTLSSGQSENYHEYDSAIYRPDLWHPNSMSLNETRATVWVLIEAQDKFYARQSVQLTPRKLPQLL